jgi:pimeloyl-ACP methyl ester carboxylesterase
VIKHLFFILFLAFSVGSSYANVSNPSDTDKEFVVIGIHGLSNKPSATQLEQWWKQALDEGLRRNLDTSLSYKFELAYWADVRNSNPVAPADQDEPYTPAAGEGVLPRYQGGALDSFRGFVQKWGGRALDKEKELIGLGTNVENIIGLKLEDMDQYYQDRSIRTAMRERLIQALQRNKESKIILVAHSMGSIIAYDVLRGLDTDTDLHIDHLITIGSPLGLPIVAEKNRQEFGDNKTPTIVRRWSNVSDPGDKVALDCVLEDEYMSNPDGVKVNDIFIVNGYTNPEGIENNHKSYGYLRAPELTELINMGLGG